MWICRMFTIVIWDKFKNVAVTLNTIFCSHGQGFNFPFTKTQMRFWDNGQQNIFQNWNMYCIPIPRVYQHVGRWSKAGECLPLQRCSMLWVSFCPWCLDAALLGASVVNSGWLARDAFTYIRVILIFRSLELILLQALALVPRELSRVKLFSRLLIFTGYPKISKFQRFSKFSQH